jgi:uncharacterized Zn finger protein (UPF0148 family)
MAIREAQVAAVIEECWEFHCPDCGFGHHELGRLARDHEIYCIVCEHESGHLVKVQRWLADENAEDQARLRAAERED